MDLSKVHSACGTAESTPIGAPGVNRRSIAKSVSFVVRVHTDQSLICISALAPEMLEIGGLNRVLDLQVGDTITIILEEDETPVTVLFKGSAEEADEFIAREMPAPTPPNLGQRFDDFMNMCDTNFKIINDRLDNIDSRLISVEGKVRAAESKKNKKAFCEASSRSLSKREVCLQFVVKVGSIDAKLQAFITRPEPLTSEMDVYDEPPSVLVERFRLPLKAVLEELRRYLRVNMNNPGRCGQLLMLLLVPFLESVKFFMPGPDSSESVRQGKTSKKAVYPKSFARLFRESLLWAGAYVFVQHDRLAFLQLAADGVNANANNYNSKRQMPPDHRQKKASFFDTVEKVIQWSERLDSSQTLTPFFLNYTEDDDQRNDVAQEVASVAENLPDESEDNRNSTSDQENDEPVAKKRFAPDPYRFDE